MSTAFLDTGVVQTVHKEAYQKLVDAYAIVNDLIKAANASDVAPLVQSFGASTKSGVQKFRDVNAAKTYGYDSTYVGGDGIGAFFSFAMAHIPDVSSSEYQYIKDATGKYITRSVDAGDARLHTSSMVETKILYDFHVARLAQLFACKVMFSLCFIVFADNPDNLSSGPPLAAIESTLTDMMGASEDIVKTYQAIKNLSQSNLDTSQIIVKMQEAIERRRSNLMSALNNESQVDTVLAWSRLWKWLAITVCCVSTVILMFAVVTGNSSIVIIILTLCVMAWITPILMRLSGMQVGMMDVSTLASNASLMLGLAR